MLAQFRKLQVCLKPCWGVLHKCIYISTTESDLEISILHRSNGSLRTCGPNRNVCKECNQSHHQHTCTHTDNVGRMSLQVCRANAISARNSACVVFQHSCWPFKPVQLSSIEFPLSTQSSVLMFSLSWSLTAMAGG